MWASWWSQTARARLVKVPLAPNQTYSFGDESGLSVKPGGSFALHLFNSADDEDEDGVLAARGSVTPEGVLAAQLPFMADAAWLKYAIDGDVSAGTAATLASTLSAWHLEYGVVLFASDFFGGGRRCHATLGSRCLIPGAHVVDEIVEFSDQLAQLVAGVQP